MDLLEKVTALAKRRGFIYPGSEIYGGLAGFYDFGPLGTELKFNIKQSWWRDTVQLRDDVVGLSSAIIMNPKAWEASGHVSSFSDLLVECKKCHQRFKKDELESNKCPECGGDLSEKKQFNLMFRTFVGPVEDQQAETYLRPETAQGMFVNFKNILETSRKKIPFGIAQIGKSFRNEINTKDYLYRIREFEIAEIEYFVKPGEDEKWFDYWLSEWQKFFLDLGIKKSNLETHTHPKEQLAHYSKKTIDLIYNFPFGKKELAGVANRTDYDLKRHQEFSGKNLAPAPLPYVIEPTLGIDRAILALLLNAFEEVKGGRTKTTKSTKEEEVVLHLDKRLSPIKVAILPLVKKLSKEAKEIYKILKGCLVAEYDEEGSIGRRYRRQDEIGTPYCVTIDFETQKDKKVTVRDRDTMKQDRVKVTQLNNYLLKKLIS